MLVPGPDGSVIHSQLSYGEALIMVAEGGAANTQCLMLYVDEVDVHCAQARAAGAVIIAEPALHDYGPEYWADISYGCTDPDGHMWRFTQRVRDPQT